MSVMIERSKAGVFYRNYYVWVFCLGFLYKTQTLVIKPQKARTKMKQRRLLCSGRQSRAKIVIHIRDIRA